MLLTACPPDEDLSYRVGASEVLADRLLEEGYTVNDVAVYGFVAELGRDQQLGTLRSAFGSGYVVDECIEMSLVLRPTGERIDAFDGPVCWEDAATTLRIELEMTTLDGK